MYLIFFYSNILLILLKMLSNLFFFEIYIYAQKNPNKYEFILHQGFIR